MGIFYNGRMRKTGEKNYLMGAGMALGLWGLLALIILFVDPAVMADWPLTQMYLGFFLILFLAVLFTVSLLLANTRRGLLVAMAAVLYGYLRVWKLGNWLNLGLIVGAILAFETYFSMGKRKDKSEDNPA